MEAGWETGAEFAATKAEAAADSVSGKEAGNEDEADEVTFEILEAVEKPDNIIGCEKEDETVVVVVVMRATEGATLPTNSDCSLD